MIIVLKNADFSANNIGQIDIPIVWDADAKAFVDSLTVELDDTKKRKVNNLFTQLKSNGIFSKLSKLYLPILGSDDAGRNLITPNDIMSLPSDTTFSNKGMKLTKGFRVEGFNRLNGSIGVYNTERISTTSGILSASVCFNSSNTDSGTNPGRAVGRAVLTSATISGLSIGASAAERIYLNAIDGVGFVAVSTNYDLVLSHCLVAPLVDSNVFGFPSAVVANPIIGGLSTGSNFGLLEASIGCIFMGQYITKNELSSLGDIVDTFIASFG